MAALIHMHSVNKEFLGAWNEKLTHCPWSGIPVLVLPRGSALCACDIKIKTNTIWIMTARHSILTFSGFSVGSYMNEEEGYLLPTLELGK